MSTKANAYIFDKEHNPLVAMHTGWEGYPESYGLRLAQFLNGYKIVNGMGCLAAQMVGHFKNGPYNIYLRSSSNLYHDSSYTYFIYPKTVEVFSTDGKLFDGSWKKFLKFCSPTVKRPRKKKSKTKSKVIKGKKS